MKRILSLLTVFSLMLCFVSCGGNYAQVDLKKPMAIPQNGIIEQSVLEQIKNENAIAIFTGSTADMKYEWIVFGSDIKTAQDVNLAVTLSKEQEGVGIQFSQKTDFGFPALLSVYLTEKWNTIGASAYYQDQAVYSVSVTGSKTTILNLSVNKLVPKCIVLPSSLESSPSSNSSVVSSPSQNTSSETSSLNAKDQYLSDTKNSDNRVYSDGKTTEKDQYETDPVPQGKPLPVEPENQEINNKKTYTCTFSIECSTILNNLATLDPDKRELIPVDGVILAPIQVSFYEGESVFDLLQRVCKEKGIHLESSWTPIYNSAYIEGIHNLYEFDCGELSGWVYRVNGWYPNYGCSRYQLADGETVEFRYTCDLGKDVGCEWMAGS